MWSSKSNGAIIYCLFSYINKALLFVDIFCCQRTPLVHVQLAVYQNPLGLFRTAAAQPCRHIFPQPESVQGVGLPLMQDSAFVLAEFHEVCVGPFPHHAKVSLEGSPPSQHFNCTPDYSHV